MKNKLKKSVITILVLSIIFSFYSSNIVYGIKLSWTFKPKSVSVRYTGEEDYISLYDAMQEIYNMAKRHDFQNFKFDPSNELILWDNTLDILNVPQQYKEAICYGVSSSILSLADVNIISSRKYCMREDLAVLLGKFFRNYEQWEGETGDYLDEAAIAETNLCYIGLLNQMKIMVGGTDNRFNPREKVTPGAFAKIMLNSEAYLNCDVCNSLSNYNQSKKYIYDYIKNSDDLHIRGFDDEDFDDEDFDDKDFDDKDFDDEDFDDENFDDKDFDDEDFDDEDFDYEITH